MVARAAAVSILLLGGLLTGARGEDDGELRVFGKTAAEFAELLASPDRSVRERAKSELYAARRTAVPMLDTLLEDPRRGVRYGTILAFYGVGTPAVEPYLVRAIADEEPEVKKLAFRGLQRCGKQTLPVLEKYIDSLPALPGSVARHGPFWTDRESGVTAFDWSPDGRFIAIGERRARVSIRDFLTGKTLVRYELPEQEIRWLRWSADGTRIAVSASGTVFAWRTRDGAGAEIPTLDQRGGSERSRDGKRVAFFLPDGRVQVWTTDESFVRSWRIGPYRGEPRRIAWAPGGDRLAVNGHDDRVAVLDFEGGIRWLPPRAAGSPVGWSPDGRRLLVSGRRALSLVTAADGEAVWIRDYRQDTAAAELSPDGARAAVCLYSGLEVLDAATGLTLRSFDTRDRGLGTPRWSPDGRYVAVRDAWANVWVIDTLAE